MFREPHNFCNKSSPDLESDTSSSTFAINSILLYLVKTKGNKKQRKYFVL